MSVAKLFEIITEIDYYVNVEIVDCVWYQSGGSFMWNTDGIVSDLIEGDGNTYSGESTMRGKVYDGYYVVNLDNGCGDTLTYFFDLSKECITKPV